MVVAGVGVDGAGAVVVAGVSEEGAAAVGVGVSSPSQAANKTIAAVSPTTASRMMRRVPSPPTFFSRPRMRRLPVAVTGCQSQPNAPVRGGLIPSIY